MSRRKRFFFEKKNQKIFVDLNRAGFTFRGLASKNFLLLFYKKEALTYFL